MTTTADLAGRLETLFGLSAVDAEHLDAHYVPEVGESNCFETAMVRAQEAYPELSLQGLMAGVIPSTRSDLAGDVYCQQVWPAAEQGRVWLWRHDEPFTWGRGAASFAQLEQMAALLERYEQEGLDDVDIAAAVDVLEMQEAPTLQERLELVDDDDLREQLAPILEGWAALGSGPDAPESGDFDTLQELLECFLPPAAEGRDATDPPSRFGWIAAALVGDAHHASLAPMDEASTSACARAIDHPDIGAQPPEALYWLFWSYFLGSEEQCRGFADALKESPARLVRDAAALVTEVLGGRSTIGTVDLHACREALQAARDARPAAPAPAADAASPRAQVRSLDLSSLDQWPPALAEFTNLEQLAIGAWEIPAAVGDYQRLRRLTVLGSLPDEVNRLTTLEQLRCGGLPPSVAGLTALRRLEVTIYGKVPADLGAMTALEELELKSEGKAFSLPPSIGGLAKLRKLSLFSRHQPGGKTAKITLCEELASLGGLEELEIRAPFAKFPKDWSAAAALRHLLIQQGDSLKNVSRLAQAPALESLHYVGDAPRGIDKLRSLQSLVLHSKLDVPAVVALVGKLPQLRRLRLSTKGMAAELRAFEQLEALALDIDEEESAALVDTIGALPSLRELELCCFASPAETSRGNPESKTFEQIECLTLAEYEPVADLFPSFETVPNLRKLVFNGLHKAPKPLPMSLSACTELREALLGPCELAPGALDGIEALRALERLELPRSSLGTLPDAIAELGQLRALCLPDNPLATLPDWLGQLPLEELDLSGCPLTALPKTLSNLHRLSRLRLGAAQLGPAQLATIASLPGLQELSIHGMRSAGVPEVLFTLGNLHRLELHQCDLGAPLGQLRQRLPNTLVVERSGWS
ncbi:MAG: hypothetical protein JRI23_06370 [Deltaproteobacteria bacterium]|jgi:Leucine-rich repeat (LRR) protein|nr:hypothetical protein [Deltaproteobacteria bacterium]MBW2531203.1 hypothetical protein [Deltaproteobacteria bacterium]